MSRWSTCAGSIRCDGPAYPRSGRPCPGERRRAQAPGAGGEAPELAQLAEKLGFHSGWTAEAYGADAMTPLAAIAATTDRIKLGTAVVQLAGRPPAMLGMQAMTVDALAGGGRMIVGVGLSGPQIVEGWYGQPWGKPNARLRDYVEILR